MLIRLTVLAAVAVLGSAASVVSAQNYIRFDVVGVVSGSSSNTVDFSVVFDTTAGPTGGGSGNIDFDAINARVVDPSAHTSDSPMFLSEPPAPVPVSATFIYIDFRDEVQIVLDTPSGFVTFVVVAPRGEFSTSMTSLPDDPTDYLVNVTDSEALVGLASPFGTFIWQPSTGDRGGFRVIVRSVDDPSLDECEADINEDGELDFFDISAFLKLFSFACP